MRSKVSKLIGTYSITGILLFLTKLQKSSSLPCNHSSEDQADMSRWERYSELTISRDSHAAAVFKSKIWIVGGVSMSYYSRRLDYTNTRSDIIFSSDGVQWTEVTDEAIFHRRFGHSLSVFTDAGSNVERLVLIGGFTPKPAIDVWTSTNGVHWDEVTTTPPWSGRGFHCSVVYKDRMWIMGGSPINNEVWSAQQVLSGEWEQQLDVPWSARAAHACTTHTVIKNTTIGYASQEEYIFMSGGWNDVTYNDVWRMDSSGSWTQLRRVSPWPRRGWHSLVSFDSRTAGDVAYGPRMWIIGGGIIGNGIAKMVPYSDSWYSRDGVIWEEASSDASGISTADWSMLKTKEKQICTGKWGHVAVPFHRKVSRSFYCAAGCVNLDNTIDHSRQLIPVCNPKTMLPDPPVRMTIVRGSVFTSAMTYPDGCGYCPGGITDRYIQNDTIPALVLIAGNTGGQKVNDVFISSDGMLCERNGEICSNQGTCTVGGSCLCNSGKVGTFCEDDADYILVEYALVTVKSGDIYYKKALGDVEVGDKVQAMNKKGQIVFSQVYYIPHENDEKVMSDFIRIIHEKSYFEGKSLELTADHLIFTTQSSDCSTSSCIDSLYPKAVRDLKTHDKILIYQDGQLHVIKVLHLEIVSYPGPMTIYTETGNVFVNDVLCSNFGYFYPTGKKWSPNNKDILASDFVPYHAFALHRFLYRLLPYKETAIFLRLFMQNTIVPMLQVLQRSIIRS